MMLKGEVYVVVMMVQVVQLLAWTTSPMVVPSVTCIESERQALLSLKRGFNVTDDYWLSSWGDEDHQKECCNWEGIKCSNVTGHVIMLDLRASGYRVLQSISPSLGELHHLTYLDLSRNHFTHTPPIPSFIGSLTFLTYLDLSSCFFGGNIPPNLGNLLFLEYLNLGGNSFDNPQQIPSQFSNLSHLVYLDLTSNNLVEFPLQVTNMSSLRYLSLSHNYLKGTIPVQLGNLLSLEHLDLSANEFTGTIPHQFRNLSRLQYLDLGPYFFDEIREKTMSLSSDLQWLSQLSTLRYLSLPWVNLSSASSWQQQVSSLSQLQYLDLNGCNLVDSMTTSSLASTSLLYVDISNNSLRDASLIFPWLMNSTGSLVTLRMNHNGLTGTIPETFGDKLSSLEVLNLTNNELKGQIPVSLFHICNLTKLDISENRFTGMVPDLSQLSSLEVLRLHNNRLSGRMHEGIGQLSNLRELSLANNLLHGLISEAHFSRLFNLQYLDLSHNAFVFNVSVDWVPPFNLSVVNLASCNLGPNFPRWLQTQMNIWKLDISQTQISSSVPNWFWDRFPTIQSLNLSHNHIEGPILPNLSPEHNHHRVKPLDRISLVFHLISGDPFNFQTIDLSFNLFEGPIPAFLSSASQLFLSSNRFSSATPLLCANSSKSTRFMDLSNNYLRGQLPDCWMDFESLVVLDLSDNQFYGNMPKSLGSLTKIKSIHFGGNNFSGEIPSSLNNCTNLQVFDAARNKLSGTIPTWIGDNISKLLVLSLHSNKFHGNIPLSMCNLHELRLLDLSLNILSGSIPKCVSKLSAMATLANSNATIIDDYHYEFFNVYDRTGPIKQRYGIYNDSASLIWKGKMSKYGSTLGLLRSIDFSSNRLTGEIPSEMMNLIGLVSLNLSRNLFSGHIPPTVGQLKSIDFLDLSRNHLSGTIPSQLAQIDRLSVLDLSYNDLSGEIPLGTQLQTRDASAYAGNPKLCGAPLNNTCPIHGHQTSEHDADADGDDEQFVTEGFYIAMAVGFVMAFWGVCFSLILKKSWRYAYFKLLSDVYDKLYVFVAIKVAKLKRIISQV
ncbi:receptor-like protein EIX2 [Arachis duranensis]|uniref:Receptor-like protein EIX2 n=1 Tax=Arachis duranensis TaxID=130453 RepID=A0A9C6TWY5_ARADU|nr:receptor-like protein EIX2 [Arachis duranensis]